ncbi:MAG: hypothetical protein A3H98_13625 [Bacteroidetes bacterium RIFCSPLOWO2_02_FULL_36_8]|nr:MAG: hypothetical protein A3H98_13625 [Bacteroidetes bacterium RIFCSPLOWO2_02_FULL_36_8]OFY71034.1 MAG: hypothetical protein A3G23_12120 [Bacteroidetes bacterium RIFCSPLOWO2_12_FULL_37_12]
MFFKSSAQIQLPAPSPKAVVSQTAGLTDITIDYSSPGVKGRKIWGELVPYNKPWRAGANAATKITFSKEVKVDTTTVPKGSYSVAITPSEKEEWTLVLNKDADAQPDDQKPENDIVRIKIKPMEIPLRERLAYSITDFNDASAMVNMEWEKVKISFNVVLGTEKQAMENINNAINPSFSVYRNAARYMLEKKDYDKGLVYINQSIAIDALKWYSHWLKAQLLKAKGMDKDAYNSVLKAKELGDKEGDGFFFKAEVEKAVVDWKPVMEVKKK